jgi:hypothetical protein
MPARPAGLCTAAVTVHHADPLHSYIASAGRGKGALTFRLLCICAGHQRNHHHNCQRGRSAAHSRVHSHARRLCCPGPFAAAAGLLQAPARSLALSSFRHGWAPLMDTGGAEAGRQIRGARVSWAWGEDVLAARPCYTSVWQPAVPVFCERCPDRLSGAPRCNREHERSFTKLDCTHSGSNPKAAPTSDRPDRLTRLLCAAVKQTDTTQ